MSVDDLTPSQRPGDSKPCPYCGERIKAIARKCRHCREYLDPGLKAENQLASAPSSVDRMLTPVGRPPSAIAAGYLGLFSLIPIPPFGLFAIAFGIRALSVLNKNPDLSGRGRAYFGIVMGVIFTLLYGAVFVALLMGY